MTTVTVNTPAPTVEPRGARFAVAAVLALRDAWQSLYAGLAKRRAYRRRLIEAAELRELASRLSRQEPGFAADLRAAADRHELS